MDNDGLYTYILFTSSLGKGFDVAWSEFLNKAKDIETLFPKWSIMLVFQMWGSEWIQIIQIQHG